MIGLLCFVLSVLASPFKSKLRLEAENAVLRHQLNVVRRRLPGRVRLTNHDYYSGKWHLGDVAEFYPIEHGFDEMKHFGAYYPGVYAYSDTSPDAHPWFPKYNAAYWAMYQKAVNLYEWSGTAGKPAIKGEIITLDNLFYFYVRQTDSAGAYIKQHAKDSKPFFMDINFMKMHQPTSPAAAFKGKSHLGNYSDSMM